jgi:hypothetical protein
MRQNRAYFMNHRLDMGVFIAIIAILIHFGHFPLERG